MRNMVTFSPLFLLCFVSLASARMIDKTAAQVNSAVLLHSDTESFKRNFSLRKEIDPFIGLTAFAPKSDREILDYLVQERLVQEKFPATDEEVEEEINAIQKNNKIDREHLREVLSSQGVRFEDYRRLMGVSVSKRKLVDRELRPLAAVSDEEVKNFYYTDSSQKENRKNQRLVLTFTLQQMILPNAATRDIAERRLKASEDFDSVAADLAGRGVESVRLGDISEENMNATIRESIQGLKVGESSRAISAGSGYIILKVLALSAPKDAAFEKEKERIRGTLFQKGLLNQLQIWTEKERALSFIQVP